MRTAYAILGLALLLVIGAALLLASKAEAPKVAEPASVLESILETNTPTAMMTLTSPEFAQNGSIPTQFSCDGDNINPELLIERVPEGAKSLVLLMSDPDIPEFVKEKMGISVFEHWVLFNMSPSVRTIAQRSVPEGAIVGENSSGGNEYRGPCPPDGEHRYFFNLYALDTVLDLTKEATKKDVEMAMQGHVLESAELLGRYAR